ncbi:aryl-phospho-beta-D-glucosidase BglC (GH1 family) [Paenibacillus sp. BK720]|nr:aryl-phospho-beta-D-glucosidase BglC (GH1 family) [Paenibacillus sp. BK720]
MKTRKKSRGFTKQIISLCKSASLLVTAAALTVSMSSSLTTVPGKAFAADSIGSAATAVQSDIVPVKSQAYDWGRVKIVGGGLIPGIIFNEKEKDLIYARTDMGGAYRWDPTTKTWIQLLEWVSKEDWNLSGVESIATDPVDPNRVYIAAGTYSNDWVQTNGYILRSQDRGQTWEKTEMPFKFGGNMPGRTMGERLVIDPNDNRILYLGARNGNGLWKSEDYGATWHKVSSFTPVGDVEDGYGGKVGPVWVTFDPSTGSAGHATQTIYVGLADRQTSIYKSVDGGATWEPVAGQPKQGFLPHHGTLGSNGMLYITYNSELGPFEGGKSGSVWKLDTKTGEWTDISPGGAGVTSNQYGGLAVDAQHPDTLMVATLNNWWPDNQIHRSTDGGQTWKPFWQFTAYPKRDNRYTIDYSISPWLDWGVQRDPETDPVTSPTLGWGIGDLEIDPFNSDRIMYGTGATLYGSEDMTNFDKGEKIRISVMANGIEENGILGLISPPSGAPLISAMGDLGGFRHEDLNTSPHTLRNPDLTVGTDLDYAETNPNLIVRVGHTLSMNPEDARMGVSTDNGITWTPAANAWQAENGDRTDGGSVAVGANGHTIVWAPKPDGSAVRPVSFSTDLGKTWTASIGIPQGASVSSDRVNPDKFYGFLDGTFYVSTDGGANFSSAASGLPNNLSGKFKAAPTAEGDIWLASSEGLFRSTDSGASFTKVNGVDEALSVGFGKEAPGKTYKTIYAALKVNGGKLGFYRSEDEGASWIRMNDDQHQFANVEATITGDGQVYGRVYIGTNGMGIVRGDIKQGAAVQGLHVNDLTVEAGKSAALAPVFDGGASSRPVVWSSSDASVASVSGEQVTGLKPGTAAIAAVSADGQYAATAVVTVKPATTMREITTMELVKEMGIGINLGNTFESTGDWINDTSVSNYETAWGSPIITKEMIKGYANEGFGVLRIPVSWSNMMGEDYAINADYLARVKEVVDWARDSGMYVILNLHWDGGWFEKFPTEKEESMHKYTRIWTQLTEAFKNYDDHLMFESFNEEGIWFDLWNFYSGQDTVVDGRKKAYALLNEINQTFVDIVRGSGGNNERRHLLIGGYGTDFEKTVDELFKMPNDPQNRCAVSVHYYTPSVFAILDEDASWGKARTEWGTDEDFAELNRLMDLVKTRFIDKGIPVIMGEFGVATKNKTQEMIRLYLTSVAKAAYSRGITPVLWDVTNVFYNRDKAEMNDKVLLEQLMAVKSATGQTPNSAPSVSITSYQDGQAINLNSPQLNWTFLDADDADVQAAYQVQASSNGWETVDADSGELAGASGLYTLNGLADGDWSIRVRAMDNRGAWSDWAYRSLIIDKVSPRLNVVLDKETLWPANNKLVKVTAIVETGDELSQVELLSITPSVAVDRYESMVQEADFGTLDTEFKLLAKKAMGNEPLVYTITYRATDQAGNVTEASATVTVPHDQGKK